MKLPRILERLLAKLRAGTATPAEIESLDRRLFALGLCATAGGLAAAPVSVLAPQRPVVGRLWLADEELILQPTGTHRWTIVGYGESPQAIVVRAR